MFVKYVQLTNSLLVGLPKKRNSRNARNPVTVTKSAVCERNPLPKQRNPLTYYEIHLYIVKTN